MATQYRRQVVVDVLNRLRHADLADEASAELPDPVDEDRLVAWADKHHLYKDELISQMGGSP
jgi:hypothetical protein